MQVLADGDAVALCGALPRRGAHGEVAEAVGVQGGGEGGEARRRDACGSGGDGGGREDGSCIVQQLSTPLVRLYWLGDWHARL